MAKTEKVTSASIKMDEREVHEAVGSFVLRNRGFYGCSGKWKIDSTSAGKNLEDGTLTMTVNLVKE